MTLLLPRPLSMAIYVILSVFVTFSFLFGRHDVPLPPFNTYDRSAALRHDLPPEKQSVIGKITMLYGDLPVYERALRSHDKHNKEHGYSMTVLRQQLLPGFWSKPAYILSRLLEEMSKPEAERLEWLVWVDVDILIMNYKVPLEIFLPPTDLYPEIHCLVTDDHNGLNNGVFFLRVNDWSVYLMTAVLGYQKASCRPAGRLRTQDQGALENVIKETQFRNNTIHAPQRWFNAFAGWRDETLAKTTKYGENSVKEGDLLVHFAGHKETREETMLKWLPIMEKHGSEWEMDLSETGYLEEVKKFWEEDAQHEVQKMLRVHDL